MCLIRDCDKPELSRGLCVTHYHRSRRKVRAKKTTWRELTRRGKALPERKRGPKPKPSA
jgi:hypothetical protein